MGGTLLLSIHLETMLSNKKCSVTAPQHWKHSEAGTTVYDIYDKAGSYNSLCSHCCQNSGWVFVKTIATLKSVPSTKILAR